jgi:hypothetical protein
MRFFNVWANIQRGIAHFDLVLVLANQEASLEFLKGSYQIRKKGPKGIICLNEELLELYLIPIYMQL